MPANTLRARAAAFIAAASTLVLAHAATAAEIDTINNGNVLFTFDSATPGTVLRARTITGLRTGDRIAAIDYRPASPRLLYGMGSSGQLYLINRNTGQAFAVGTPTPLVGGPLASIGFDFNPSVDRIRVTTSFGQNLRLNPDTGALAGTDGPLAYAATDPGRGTPPAIVGAAYTNNVAGGTPTTLYVIDATRGVLATQGSVNSAPVSPNTGTLFTVGSLGVRTNTAVGFDISGQGQVLATLTSPTTLVTSLYSVNLTTGAATLIGALSGNATYEGLAFGLAPFGASTGATANQQAVGAALDNFSAVPSASMVALFNGLDASAGGPAQGLGILSPQSFTVLPELTFRTMHSQADAIGEHLRNSRSGSGMTVDGAAIGGGGRGYGMFVSGIVRDGSFDAATDRPEVDYSAGGAMIGFDVRPFGGILLGAALGYDSTGARLGNGAFTEIDSSWVAGYGSAVYNTGAFGSLFIDGFVSGGDAEFELRRPINLPGVSSTAIADAQGTVYGAGANVGAAFTYGGLIVEPFVGVRYAKFEMDGFSERGAGAASLTLGDQEEESTQSRVGARVSFASGFGGGVLRPEFRAAWVHEFEAEENRAIRTSFGDSAMPSFVFNTTPVDDADTAELGASLSFTGYGGMTVTAAATGRTGGDVKEGALNLSLRVPF